MLFGRQNLNGYREAGSAFASYSLVTAMRPMVLESDIARTLVQRHPCRIF